MHSGSIRTTLVLCLIAGMCLHANGQVEVQLQALDSHFAGVWVGTNHDYTKIPMVTNHVRIVIKDNPKKGELRFEYTYGTKGQKGYEHLVRFLAIKPERSMVDFNWQHDPKEHCKAVGLDEVLGTGYGEFRCSYSVRTDRKDVWYRGIFRIEPDQFTYSWDKGDNQVDYVKSGEWTLTRESTASSGSRSTSSH